MRLAGPANGFSTAANGAAGTVCVAGIAAAAAAAAAALSCRTASDFRRFVQLLK
jgi:hypothetical protein